MFNGHCAVHGNVFVRLGGHHSTNSEKKLKRKFNKPDRGILKQLLTAKEWDEFSESIEGQRIPQEATIKKWRLLLAENKNKPENSS